MDKLKPKRIELGTDSRNVAYFGQNGSNRFKKSEKKLIEIENLENAFTNSIEKSKKIELKIENSKISQ